MSTQSRSQFIAGAAGLGLLLPGCIIHPPGRKRVDQKQPRPGEGVHSGKRPDWRYIIIHHTATDGGNLASIDRGHKRRGWEGIGYHFLINNGTSGTRMGEVNPTYRWKQKLTGHHCSASDMNLKGVGVCLVGNFSDYTVPTRQLESVIHVVRTLQQKLKIPKSRIIMHGKVTGAATECPGKLFPWESFIRRVI
jgi:N-acetylmuramoyl-L-alanine amidase